MVVSVREAAARITECSLIIPAFRLASSGLDSVLTVLSVSSDAVDNSIFYTPLDKQYQAYSMKFDDIDAQLVSKEILAPD